MDPSAEEREICFHVAIPQRVSLIPLDRYSSFTHLKRVTAWILRFVNNSPTQGDQRNTVPRLSIQELLNAETYWLVYSQGEQFEEEIEALGTNQNLSKSSPLFTLRPIVGSDGVLRVGGRLENSQLCYSTRHPAILNGKHQVTKLIIQSEHLCLLHGGPTLVAASLCSRYHIIGSRKTIRSVIRGCIACRKASARPRPQLLGQLPGERTTPGSVFNHAGVDYAGPVYIKYGFIRKPTTVKAYICVFVSLSVKAIHLELVSDLTTEAFIASLRRFIARRGKPLSIWSDHGTNFVGAARELKEFSQFLKERGTQNIISEFCTSQNREWKFIPERAPHFGGLWEAAVKSMKSHLKHVIKDTKLTFEEFSTVLTQIEACLNSRPLTPLPSSRDGDAIEVLTPDHFLVGKPLESIPDHSMSYRSVSLLRRWHLCQSMVCHFWQRWSSEYIATLRHYTKWYKPERNMQVGDVVVLQENNVIPTKWPLARVMETHPGNDGLVRVVTVKTSSGVYKRPVTKIAVLLPQD